MHLQNLLDEGKLRRHRTSAKEIAELLQVADRDLADWQMRPSRGSHLTHGM
jgi:hypothetical protein